MANDPDQKIALAGLLKEEDLWQQLELPDNPDGTAFRREDSPHVLQIIKIIGIIAKKTTQCNLFGVLFMWGSGFFFL